MSSSGQLHCSLWSTTTLSASEQTRPVAEHCSPSSSTHPQLIARRDVAEMMQIVGLKSVASVPGFHPISSFWVYAKMEGEGLEGFVVNYAYPPRWTELGRSFWLKAFFRFDNEWHVFKIWRWQPSLLFLKTVKSCMGGSGEKAYVVLVLFLLETILIPVHETRAYMTMGFSPSL